MSRLGLLLACLCGLAIWPGWVLADLQVVPVTSLSFGSYAAPKGGVITMSPTGVRHASSGVLLLASGVASPGQVLVKNTGFDVQTVEVELPQTAMLTSSITRLTLTNLVADPAVLVLAPGQSITVRIGAALRPTAQPPAGTYSAQIPLRFIQHQK